MQGNWWSFWQNRNTVNTELGALRMKRDERDVQMILKCLKNWTPKYVACRSTNQRYCNRKNSHRADEQKYTKSQGMRTPSNE